MYPKARIDALTDGIFAVAMTMLVLDVRLPEFHRADAAALARALKQLWPKAFPYIPSFYVLGDSWLSMVRLRSRGEFVDRRYAVWWLLHLLLATCLSFSTTVVGRFAQLAPYRRGSMPPTWLPCRRSAIGSSCSRPTLKTASKLATAKFLCSC
jgi:uncharacterized membrane protein